MSAAGREAAVERIREHREDLEALADSDLQTAKVAAALLDALEEHETEGGD